MVNLALNNGQVMQTSLANLQAMAQSNLLNNHANTGNDVMFFFNWIENYHWKKSNSHNCST